jgi:26S proteasome regulatory subunit T2
MGNQQGGQQDRNKPPQKPKRPYNLQVGKGAKNKSAIFNPTKLPDVTPSLKCKLRLARQDRIKDYLLIEREFVESKEKQKADKEKNPANTEEGMSQERKKVESLRGTPLLIGTLEEFIDENHGIVSSQPSVEYYVPIPSFVDRTQLQPGQSILCHANSMAVVGVLQDDTNPLLNVMKVENAPTETYGDVGGLEEQIQEIKEAIELPLSHPEIYEDIGIKPPKGVILYGEPGTGKTLLVKAVAHETSATFLRLVGSELIQKYLGEGPKLVRELFKCAEENAPSIIFIDEIDAIGTKRYNSNSGGEREIQRTMLELLNQLDGFDTRANVKVIMATNKIESLDPALIRPGRIDRKINFPLPDQKALRKIMSIHTAKMSLMEDVNLDEIVNTKEPLTGADIKAICTEAGLLTLRERRMKVGMKDFVKAKEKTLHLKKANIPENLYG